MKTRSRSFFFGGLPQGDRIDRMRFMGVLHLDVYLKYLLVNFRLQLVHVKLILNMYLWLLFQDIFQLLFHLSMDCLSKVRLSQSRFVL